LPSTTRFSITQKHIVSGSKLFMIFVCSCEKKAPGRWKPDPNTILALGI